MLESATILIDGNPISFAKMLKYLQSSGKMKDFLGEVIVQYVLENELEERSYLKVTDEEIEQEISTFRQENQLILNSLDEWLTSQGLDHGTLRQQISNKLRIEQLKSEVSASKLIDFFIEQKVFLDRIVLSRIVVHKMEIAEELRTQIDEGASFADLARQYSITDDRIFNGMMGLISRGQLSDQVRSRIDASKIGEIIGPVEIDNSWWLLKVEDFLPASLNDALMSQLSEEVFQQWLLKKVQTVTVDVRF